jgi:hypothetical protein
MPRAIARLDTPVARETIEIPPLIDGETFRGGNQSAHPLIHCGQQTLEAALYRVYINH